MNKVDWSKAPEGAEWFAFMDFYKIDDCGEIRHFSKHDGAWLLARQSDLSKHKESITYQQKPKQWPESDERIDIVGTNGNDGEHYQQEATKTAADFLSEGLRILSERGKQYGSEGGERSFAQVAQAFTAVTGKQLVGSDVCLILALVKQVRQYAQPRYHHDSAVDAVNYLALQAEELQKERA